MPSQAVTAKIRVVGHGPCSNCGIYAQLIELRISVGEELPEDASVKRCSRCILGSNVTTSTEAHPESFRYRRRLLKQARKCEERTAKETGSRRTGASGAGIEKGDSRNSRFMFEDKYTENEFYRLTKTTILKAIAQAQKSGRTPVVRVHLNDGPTIGIMHWNDLVQFVSEEHEGTNQQTAENSEGV